MEKIGLFIKKPTRILFESLGISGDTEKMNYLYTHAPHLAQRYFTCEDWVELCQHQKKFDTRTDLLRRAVSVIGSIEDCKRVFCEDRRYEFFHEIKVKAVEYCVSFEDILETICTFELTQDENDYNKYGKKLVKRAINLVTTPEDVDKFTGVVPIDDPDAILELGEKARGICPDLFES